MPRFSMEGLQDVISDMIRMGQESGPVAESMLMAGAEEVKKAWQQSASEHGHVLTGAMIESIGYAKRPNAIGDALAIDICPQGSDGHGVRNVEKAFLLNYGTSKMPGSGWVFDADAICEKTVVPAMEKVWDDFVGGESAGGGITTKRT